jgi:hypothetical protein
VKSVKILDIPSLIHAVVADKQPIDAIVHEIPGESADLSLKIVYDFRLLIFLKNYFWISHTLEIQLKENTAKRFHTRSSAS